MRQEDAEALALQAVAWLIGENELLMAFLAASGAGAEDLRDRLQDPAFLGAVLDFLLLEDRFVLDFAASAGIDPLRIGAARQALPGGHQTHWT